METRHLSQPSAQKSAPDNELKKQAVPEKQPVTSEKEMQQIPASVQPIANEIVSKEVEINQEKSLPTINAEAEIEEENLEALSPWTKEIIKPVFVGIFVGNLLHPGNLLLTYLQTKQKDNTPIQPLNAGGKGILSSFSTAFFLAHWKSLVRSYFGAMGHSVTKNAVITQSGRVHEQMNEIIGNKGTPSPGSETSSHSEVVTEAEWISAPMSKKMLASVGSGVVLGFIDTMVTHPWHNFNSYNAILVAKEARKKQMMQPQNAAHLSGDHPNPSQVKFFKVMMDPKFITMGMQPRLIGSIGNANIYVFSITILPEKINKFFPKEQYGLTANILSLGAAGVIGGVSNNVFSLLYNTTLDLADPKTFRTPNLSYVIKHLYAQGGLKTFRRGLLTTMGITTTAYFGVRAGENIFDDLYLKYHHTVKSFLQQKFGFFSKPMFPHQETTKNQDVSQKHISPRRP